MTLEEKRIAKLEKMADEAERGGDVDTAALLRWAAATCAQVYSSQ